MGFIRSGGLELITVTVVINSNFLINAKFQSLSFSMEQFVEMNFKWIYNTDANEDDMIEITSNSLYSVYDKVTDLGVTVNVLELLYSSADYNGNYRCLIYGKTESGEAVYKVCRF